MTERLSKCIDSKLDRSNFCTIISKIHSLSGFNYVLNKYHIDKLAENIMIFKNPNLILDRIHNILIDQIDEPYDIKIKHSQYGYRSFSRNRERFTVAI